MVRSGQPSRGPSARRVGSARQARGRAHLPGCGAAHSASHAHSFARSQRAECGAALRLSWRSRVRRPGEPPEQVRVAPSFARGSEPHCGFQENTVKNWGKKMLRKQNPRRTRTERERLASLETSGLSHWGVVWAGWLSGVGIFNTPCTVRVKSGTHTPAA